MAKYLSPSHAQESGSKYGDYNDFLKNISQADEAIQVKLGEKLIKNGFQGFVANRFGRTGILSVTFLEHLPLLEKFFSKSVEEHQNKFALACFTYIHSEYFKVCCSVAAFTYKHLVEPLMMAMGIDKFKHVASEYRSWDGLKRFSRKESNGWKIN